MERLPLHHKRLADLTWRRTAGELSLRLVHCATPRGTTIDTHMCGFIR